MCVDVAEEEKKEKKKGKHFMLPKVAIETEENDIEIRIVRAKNDIQEEK